MAGKDQRLCNYISYALGKPYAIAIVVEQYFSPQIHILSCFGLKYFTLDDI